MNTSTNRNEELWQAFQSVNGWLVFADAKAAGIIAMDGVIINAFIENRDRIILEAQKGFWYLFLSLFSVGMLGLSLYFACRCLSPRLSLRNFWARWGKKENTSAKSVLYFCDIASMSKAAFGAAIDLALQDDLNWADQIKQQMWINSQIARNKHNDVNSAINLLMLVFPFLLLLILLTPLAKI